jgi:hypothetical protein
MKELFDRWGTRASEHAETVLHLQQVLLTTEKKVKSILS